MQKVRSSVLSELVDRVSPTPGVVAIVLFGSVARGEADEYSDLDLLILFKDRASLWDGWNSLFKEIGSMNLNIHAIPETLDEFKGANPVFLEELEKHGKVLYSRLPFTLTVGSPLRRPFSIISYDLRSLSSKEKMRILYRLYESGGGGDVGRSGGIKLGSGCILVPHGESSGLVNFIESRGAEAFKIDVLLEESESAQLNGSRNRQRKLEKVK